MPWSSKKKCIKKTLIIAQFATHWSNLMCPSQIPGISSWMLVHQCLGSGSELRKSSVSSEGVHQSDVSCEMFWSSSSRRKVAHIDKCCRTWRASEQLGCGAEALCQGWTVETVRRPQHHTLTSACHCTGVQSAPFGGWLVRFHINCEGITEQFKPTFLDIKVGKSPAKLSAEYTEFFSKLCAWEHSGRDLRFYGLAAGKMAKVSLQHLILPQAQFSFKGSHCRPWSCRFSASRWLEMSQRKASSHRNFCSRSSAVSFPLVSRNWHISSRSSKHLFSTFPLLSHLTSVWYGTSAYSEPHSSRKDLNWRWFRPLALIKLTTCVTVVITCSTFRALAHSDSWCMMQW